ncbi:MAG: hypothetical protein V1792_21415 [Pseudomonadota bacterium]
MRKRVVMLKRSLILMVCISMVGVTVLPASLLPCCCKFEGDKPAARGAPTCCPVHKAISPVLPQTPRQGSCCSESLPVEQIDQPTCCSRQIGLQNNCGKCRCLEQMQLVTLSGYSVGQTAVRTPAVDEASVGLSLPAVPGRHIIHVGPGIYIPKNVVLLKTCTLLI